MLKQLITKPFSSFLKTVSSYNSNILLSALISLLLVIFFISILHFYARYFWSEAQRRRRRRRTQRFHTLTNPETIASNHNITYTSYGCMKTGLDSSVISSIPLFVYDDEKSAVELECVICLSFFEVGEYCRRLKKCGHGFHVECIDMWLGSHSTCPLCRAPVLNDDDNPKQTNINNNNNDYRNDSDEHEISPEVGSGEDDDENRCSRLEIASGDDRRSSSSSSLGCDLERMMSCRNTLDRKAFPSCNNLSETDD